MAKKKAPPKKAAPKKAVKKAVKKPAKKTAARDIEKSYTTKQMVAKLRRLADCLEQGKPYQIQIAGERLYIPADAVFNIEHEREGKEQEVEFQFRWPVK